MIMIVVRLAFASFFSLLLLAHLDHVRAGDLVVIRAASGATARVSASAAPKFRAFLKDFEAAGGTVRFMGGWRQGTCATASKHPCGMAIDICQYSRGVVDRRCRYPAGTAEMARRHGLLDGRVWRDNDLGHIEVRHR